MEKQSQDKTISLSPSWKNHIVGYVISILLIPFFGIGLATMYWVRKKQKKYSYQFSDTRVTAQDDKFQRNIDLVNIERVKVEQSYIQQKMGVGNVELYTSASSITLRGMENPVDLKEALEKAIYAEKERKEQQEKTKPEEAEYDPGTMERMDYLTGLWQQGLVSDEEYEEERKHFE